MSDHVCEVSGCGRPTQDTLCGEHRGKLRELLVSIAHGPVQRRRTHLRRAQRPRFGPSCRPPCRHVSCAAVRAGQQLVTEVDWLPGLWEELQTVLARQHRLTGSSGEQSSESVLPFHEVAGAVAAQLGNAVVSWARAVADMWPHLTLSARSVPDAALWLSTVPGLLAEHPAAGELYGDIARWTHRVQSVIDKAPDKVFAGLCGVEGCRADLYAALGKERISCRVCGAEHEASERKRRLSEQLVDALVTAAEAAPYLSWSLDKPIKPEVIWNWKRCGRVEVHPGSRPYRFGDLEALAREFEPRGPKRSKEGSST